MTAWASVVAQPSVAILATGDELVNGDICETNGAQIAQALSATGVQVALQMAVSDDQVAIVDALHVLLSRHQVVITMGGLGPTSDDLTRFAVAEALGTECQFNADIWSRIQARYQARNMPCPGSNRQQAMLPLGMTVLPNANGTADGGMFEAHGRLVAMLPGPPGECLPIFNEQVLAAVTDFLGVSPRDRRQWLLFNVGESWLADQLAPLLADYPEVEVGYLADFPYQTLKLAHPTQAVPAALIEQIESQFADAIISRDNQDLIDQCKAWLRGLDQPICIIDQVTGGQLQAALQDVDTAPSLVFAHMPPSSDAYQRVISLRGGERYWQGEPHGYSIEIVAHGAVEQLTELEVNWPARFFQRLVVGLVCQHLLRQN